MVPRGGGIRRGLDDGSGSGYWNEEVEEVGEIGGVNFLWLQSRFGEFCQKYCQSHLQDFSLINWSSIIVALASWIHISCSIHCIVE